MTGAALVTGSARGIGRALVLRLAREGYDVAVHYRSSAEAAQAVAEEARSFGVAAAVVRADVTDRAEATALVDEAAARLGRLDVLVNNVGAYHYGPLEELEADTWHEMLDSNLTATFHTCQRAAPLLRDSPQGRIVNLGYAGSDALSGKPGIVAYQIAKTGVLLYSRALAKREAPHGTTVNVLAPGVMENSVTKPRGEIPMGRPGTLDEIAAALAYLVSFEARYVTGAFLPISGGWNV
ncbi:MAG: SDR family oxidoreductase [Trueperaceae bacterium]|nr:SDR family oxidoreductase [Trueperaceae bacterium]